MPNDLGQDTLLPAVISASRGAGRVSVEPDRGATELFLRTLAPDSEHFSFQTFGDDSRQKRPDLVKIFHGPLKDHWDSLARLSAQGAGIFLAINETNLRGRKTDDIVRVRAVFGDFDGAPFENIARLGLRPHVCVESSRGRFHAYWRISDLPLDQFKPIQTKLAQLFESDGSVVDLPRVMRLPGFPHQKREPFMPKMATPGTHPPYTNEQITNAVNSALARSSGGQALAGLATLAGSPPRMRDPIADSVMGGISKGQPDMKQGYSEGQRNNELTRRAGFLLGLHGGNLNVEEAVTACLEWNAHNMPPLEADEVERTVRSLARKEAKRRESEGLAPAGATETAVDIVEPPRPLRREMLPAAPFPIEALGLILGDAARGIHDLIQAPMAIAAQSVLAVAALATQAHADVLLPIGHARPLSCFFITIAGSGERKSACDHEALWPVRKREACLRQQGEIDATQYANQRDIYEKLRTKVLKGGKDRATLARELDALGPSPVPPLHPLLTCPEPTFEGLCKLLEAGHASIGLFSAEGGQFIGGHAMSADNRLKTAAAMSGLWDGEPIRRVRAGDGVIVLPGRRVSVHLMAQPDVAGGFLSDAMLIDQGILSRVLISAPPSAAGTRFSREPRPESDAAIKRYGARILSILETAPRLVQGTRNELEPRQLAMSQQAVRRWREFADEIEREIAPGCRLDRIAGLANKIPEHAARLSAVLALIEDLKVSEISVAHLEAGMALARHYADEALRLFEAGTVNPEVKLAERLLAWLQSDWKEAAVSLPTIYQLGPNSIRDKATALHAVNILVDHGWLRKIEGGATVSGQHRRDAWTVIRPNA